MCVCAILGKSAPKFFNGKLAFSDYSPAITRHNFHSIFAQSVGCIINYNHASNSQKSINETGGGQVKSAREKRSDLARVRNGHLEGLARLKPQNRFVVKVHLLEELTADDCVEGRCAGDDDDDDDENSSRQSVTTVAWNCMTKRCQNEKPATN